MAGEPISRRHAAAVVVLATAMVLALGGVWTLGGMLSTALVSLPLCSGLLLIVFGLRESSIPGTRLCAACHFDLAGHSQGAGRCPECGAAIGRPGSVRARRRGAAAVPIAIGITVLLTGLAGGGFVAASRASGGASSFGLAPEWMLKGLVMPLGSSGQRNRAIDELRQRIERRSPTEADLRWLGSLSGRMLDQLEMSGEPMHMRHAEVLMLALHRGALRDGDFPRLLDQVADLSWRLVQDEAASRLHAEVQIQRGAARTSSAGLSHPVEVRWSLSPEVPGSPLQVIQLSSFELSPGTLGEGLTWPAPATPFTLEVHVARHERSPDDVWVRRVHVTPALDDEIIDPVTAGQ